ncbi:MAG: cation transporter [Candidatus Pristimantibacillus sp.]
MTKQTLQVEGMSCQHCVISIEGALKEIGAAGKVNLASGYPKRDKEWKLPGGK